MLKLKKYYMNTLNYHVFTFFVDNMPKNNNVQYMCNDLVCRKEVHNTTWKYKNFDDLASIIRAVSIHFQRASENNLISLFNLTILLWKQIFIACHHAHCCGILKVFKCLY